MAIELKKFRKINSISQNELGQFLELSRGFISIVEIGKSKLADDKIDQLYFHQNKSWDVSELNPTYWRLQTIITELIKRRKWIPHQLDEYGNNPFGIDKDTICKIRHGKMEILPSVAEDICRTYKDIDYEWLLTGKGKPFKFEQDYGELDEDGIPYDPAPIFENFNERELLYNIYRALCSIDQKIDEYLREKNK